MIHSAQSPWTGRLLWFVGPALIGAAAWWWGIAQFVTGQVNLTTNIVANISRPTIVALLGLGLWLGSGLVAMYVSPWRSVRWTLAAVIALPVCGFFVFSWWTTLAWVVVAVGLSWSFEQAHGDLRNRLTVHPLQTLNQNLSVALTAVMVAVAILSYQQVVHSSQPSAVTTERLSGQLVDVTEQFLPRFYQGYQPDMTVDDLIASQLPTADTLLRDINFSQLTTQTAQQQALDDKLSSLGLDPQQANINVNVDTIELRNQLTDRLNLYRQDAVAQARDELSQRFTLSLKGTERIHDVLVTYVNRQLTTSLGRYVGFLPLLMAIGVFLLLRLFSFLYTWIIVGWGWLWFSAVRWMDVVRLVTTTVSGQRAEWKP